MARMQQSTRCFIFSTMGISALAVCLAASFVIGSGAFSNPDIGGYAILEEAHAQQQIQTSKSNPSVQLQQISIPYDNFNTVSRDAFSSSLKGKHPQNWQVKIQNHVKYNNPDGNAIVRLVADAEKEKFIEIAMGSPPDRKFWVAIKVPDSGYAVVHERIKNGWVEGEEITLSHQPASGLSVNNGKRIVVSDLDLDGFTIASYSTYGMLSSTDPPAARDGSLDMEIISGDPSKNPLFFVPFALAAAAGIVVGLLLLTKKRSASSPKRSSAKKQQG